MKCFGLTRILLTFTFVAVIKARQTCEPPDRPADGDYVERTERDKFQAGDEITYICSENYILTGKEKSKCRHNGDWSNPTPFCDRKVGLRNSVFNNNGTPRSNPNVVDGNFTTCNPLTSGDSMSIALDKRGAVLAVRIFLRQETERWILLECNDTFADSIIGIQGKSDRSSKRNDSTICEVEVYAKEEESCVEPPKRISNGYLEVGRSVAKLVCKEGYRSEDTRLVCERSGWIESSRLDCSETLCDPKVRHLKEPGTDWSFPDDDVRKISVGTKRLLRCSGGYAKEGSPDVISCEKDGTWTRTNATCKEILCDPTFKPSEGAGVEWIFLDDVKKNSVGSIRQLRCSTGYEKTGYPDLVQCQQDRSWSRTNATCREKKTENSGIMKGKTLIIIIVVGVVLLILALIGTTIYFVRKQRGKEVIVVYKNPPTEGSVVSDTDYASGFYETIHDNTITVPTISRSVPPISATAGYYLRPEGGKDTLRKSPADLALNKHCQLYK